MAAMFDERSTEAARASRNKRLRSSGHVGPACSTFTATVRPRRVSSAR